MYIFFSIFFYYCTVKYFRTNLTLHLFLFILLTLGIMLVN